MKTIKYLIIFTFSLFVMNSCEDGPSTSDLNYISFEGTSTVFPVNLEGTTEQTIMLYTTNKVTSDRTYGVVVDLDASTADPASYNVPSTVTIPSNSNVGELVVSLTNLNIGVAGKVLVLKLENQEDLFTGEDIKLNVVQSCPGNEVFLDITFDGYASECSWELVDSSDAIVASGSGYKDGDTSYATSFCLGVGTYTFSIYDAYGDGLTYPNLGGVTLTKNDVDLVNIDGDYGSETSETFEVN